MQAVLETVLDSSLTYSHECRDGAHLGITSQSTTKTNPTSQDLKVINYKN